MKSYRKKPVVIQAAQWTGSNSDEMAKFMKGGRDFYFKDHELYIVTLEGDHRASKDDWIIRGVSGEFYPCKPDIFEKTYEPA